MSEGSDLGQRVGGFVEEVTRAMGLELDVTIEEQPDHVRIVLAGTGSEGFLHRKGEALEALQHVVNSVFRREVDRGRRLVVDSHDFRKGKDRELRQMTRFLMDKVRSTGTPQEVGPLNSYARRLVHLEVSAHDDMASESLGDGSMKIVLISRKPQPRPH
jgi:spoIIIJ-associated protein